MKLLIIGAGQSGRGFIPQFVNPEDDLFFVDKNIKLINQLNAAGSYDICYYGMEKKLTISNFRAYSWDSLPASVADSCDFIATSIGEENFSDIVEKLKKYAKVFQKVFITFENGTNPAGKLEKIIRERTAIAPTVTQTAIFTTTTNRGIDIGSQDYLSLAYDCERYRADFPFHHTVPTRAFTTLLQRKIYTYNCLSAVISYPGYSRGYETLSDATEDSQISGLIEDVLKVLNPALAREFKISPEEQKAFADQALKKFQNPYIYDTIERNSRAVERKLGLKERFFGPIQIIEKYDLNAEALYRIVAYALQYNLKNEGKLPLQTLLDGTGLDENHHYVKLSLQEHAKLF
jgi:mannitol-1-phosphate 5-dehydrogenase